MTKTVLIILTATIFTAFTTNPKTDFYNTKWLLKKIYMEGEMQEIKAKRAFIKFDKEKQSAGGNGSCNSFGGSAIVNSDSLTFGNLFSTKMYCNDVQATEDNFFISLSKVNRFMIKDKTLLLLHGEDVLLEFESE